MLEANSLAIGTFCFHLTVFVICNNKEIRWQILLIFLYISLKQMEMPNTVYVYKFYISKMKMICKILHHLNYSFRAMKFDWYFANSAFLKMIF